MLNGIRPLSIFIGHDANTNANPAFKAGELLVGKIVINVRKFLNLKQILLRIDGRARTADSFMAYVNSKEECYINKEIDKSDYLHQACINGLLSPQIHDINFLIDLPLNLPSSMRSFGLLNHEQGSIQYSLTAVLISSFDGQPDIVCKRLFNVIGHVDLRHQYPQLAIPFVKTVTKKVYRRQYCFKISKGSILFKLLIPQTGYVANEIISISCDIINNCRLTISYISVTLYEIQTLEVADGIHKTISMKLHRHDNIISGVECTRIKPGEKLTLTNRPFKLPGKILPLLIGCSIIEVKHVLEICVDKFITIPIPIAIGTVPINPANADDGDDDLDDVNLHLQELLLPPHQLSLDDNTITPLIDFNDNGSSKSPESPPPDYCYFEPPSYQECLDVKKSQNL